MVDWLTNYAFSFDLGCHVLCEPPVGVIPLLVDELKGFMTRVCHFRDLFNHNSGKYKGY